MKGSSRTLAIRMRTAAVMTVAIAVACLAVDVAHASKKTALRSYIVADVGQTSSDFKDPALFRGSVDDEDTGWAFGGGWRGNDHVAVELLWVDLGEVSFDGSFNFMGTFSSDIGTIEAEGIEASVLGVLPVSESVSIYGRLGAFSWDVEENEVFAGFPERATASGTDPVYGAGVELMRNRPVTVRIEWKRFADVGDDAGFRGSDVDFLKAGVTFRFENMPGLRRN